MLYKYRSWEDNMQRRWLTVPEIYFSQLEDFNDPFDSSLRYRYENLSIEEQKIAIRKNANRELTDDEVNELWGKSAFANPELFDKHFEEVALPMINERFGICSLTTNYDNILMWSHYANSHKGFCIGYNEELQKSLRFNHYLADKKTFIDLHEVEYHEKYPEVNPIEMDPKKYGIYLLTVKSKDWCYENEKRLISVPRAGFASQVSNKLIEEIRLGCKMPEEVVSKVVECVEEKIPHAKIFRAIKGNTKFGLSFEEIAG